MSRANNRYAEGNCQAPKSRASIALALAAAWALVGSAAAGCAGQGDVDRTQPDKIDKAIFVNADGSPKVFYYRWTITDIPPTSAWMFEGFQGPMEKVTFKITEDQLIGYRAYDYA